MSTKQAETKAKTSEKVKAMDEKSYYNQKVTVKLFKDNDKYKDDVFVAVNGVGMIVPRGIEVKIPRKYAVALDNSQIQDGESAQYQMDLSSKSAASELND